MARYKSAGFFLTWLGDIFFTTFVPPPRFLKKQQQQQTNKQLYC